MEKKKMPVNDLNIKYEFLDSSKNFIYDARETGKTHTSFQYEILLFTAIKNGDVYGVRKALDTYKASGLIIGHMSDNPSREIHYWAVSTIAVAIHYAILGGLDESEAYQLSDKYIQEIDLFRTMEECIDYLCQKAVDLVTKVKENKVPQCYSPLINKCIHLIHIDLHSRLKIESIAKALHISRDYFSQAFKKETGVSIHQYILNQKLEEAKNMLLLGMSINEVSYTLSFCNESHFIQAFKKKYNMTPAVFLLTALS